MIDTIPIEEYTQICC